MYGPVIRLLNRFLGENSAANYRLGGAQKKNLLETSPEKKRRLSLFQNPVGFGQALGKTGQQPGFSRYIKEAVPKTEVLEQPRLKIRKRMKKY
ncbi:MAG: hypothetical protein LBK40_06655 [Spirochaetaceae bacterium]|nr:hypothetical protein [Spirochaetaceae bacterium]